MQSIICILIMATMPLACLSANILMATMSPTMSHKIPLMAYAKGLLAKNHTITFVSGFPPHDKPIKGVREIAPPGLVEFYNNYTNWDIVTGRRTHWFSVPLDQQLAFGALGCQELLADSEVRGLFNEKFDLAVIDSTFTECMTGVVYRLGVPHIQFNTIAFYSDVMSVMGNPVPYSTLPVLYMALNEKMNFFQRLLNAGNFVGQHIFYYKIKRDVLKVMRKHLGNDIPTVNHIIRNASFVLVNSHPAITYPRPYLPNVAEIACLHCHEAHQLPEHLEEFIRSSGEAGFIYVSLGSSVKTTNTPRGFFEMLITVFSRLPVHVLWKCDHNVTDVFDLPSNVMTSRWLPQQDVLGHKMVRGFFTHGGLFSLLETVYHGVPIILTPVFYDQDANAAAAAYHGYGEVLQLNDVTAEKVQTALNKIIFDPKYRREAKLRQRLLREQQNPPLETAVYWTEYVLKNNGAPYLQSPSKYMSVVEYYCFDLILFSFFFFKILGHFVCKFVWFDFRRINKSKIE